LQSLSCMEPRTGTARATTSDISTILSFQGTLHKLFGKIRLSLGSPKLLDEAGLTLYAITILRVTIKDSLIRTWLGLSRCTYG
jgi:hypothetical protein